MSRDPEKRVEYDQVAPTYDERFAYYAGARKGVGDEPMLQKNATSQLTLLSDEGYSAGIDRIRTAITNAEASGEEIAFPVDISLQMVVGLVEKR
ncbi:MAG: hypothetical protein ACRELA_08285 [Candidatus Rokuibacteriota bacterium]